jgi:hypothetical protein
MAASIAGALAGCAEPAPSEAPERVVERLYDPYFGRAEAQRLENAAPWTDDLRELIAQADRRTRATGAPWITINPFFGASDVLLGDLAVTPEAPPEGGRVNVVARFTNAGTPAQVTYNLVAVGGAWRVDNIRGDTWDLRSALAGAPAVPAAAPAATETTAPAATGATPPAAPAPAPPT